MAILLPKNITLAWLKRTGACEKKLDDFAVDHPSGRVPVTRANLKKAAENGESIWWLGNHGLDGDELKIWKAKYGRIKAAYKRAKTEAKRTEWSSEGYKRKKATARAAYFTKCADLLADLLDLPAPAVKVEPKPARRR